MKAVRGFPILGSIGLIVASCASPAAPPSSAEIEALQKPVLVCLHNAARKTDDGHSDAITIAVAIKSICLREFARAEEAYMRGQNLEVQRMLAPKLESLRIEIATTAVLDERRIRSKEASAGAE